MDDADGGRADRAASGKAYRAASALATLDSRCGAVPCARDRRRRERSTLVVGVLACVRREHFILREVCRACLQNPRGLAHARITKPR